MCKINQFFFSFFPKSLYYSDSWERVFQRINEISCAKNCGIKQKVMSPIYFRSNNKHRS